MLFQFLLRWTMNRLMKSKNLCLWISIHRIYIDIMIDIFDPIKIFQKAYLLFNIDSTFLIENGDHNEIFYYWVCLGSRKLVVYFLYQWSHLLSVYLAYLIGIGFLCDKCKSVIHRCSQFLILLKNQVVKKWPILSRTGKINP